MMNQILTANYFENENIQLIQLPFQNADLSAFIILPKSIDELVENFNIKDLINQKFQSKIQK